ncbi:hypothetical protein ATK36_4547 [Amycolatopsis sulphurea]|uniref:Uncharacterized protein n=1 Tax=Amycolatopsis sulphurea TaxID=76022 RepID=A0A2A9FDG0_9PSEU|nr:hypothetical protein ATK36_4547 [Amycolatopsis sulphurea]
MTVRQWFLLAVAPWEYSDKATACGAGTNLRDGMADRRSAALGPIPV